MGRERKLISRATVDQQHRWWRRQCVRFKCASSPWARGARGFHFTLHSHSHSRRSRL